MTVFTTDTLPAGHYAPPTGLSRFSGVYNDVTNTFTVTVRGTMNWAGQMGTLAWTGTRRNEFMRLFQQGIDQVWNGRFRLENTSGHVVRPTVQFVPVLNNAHMSVRVQAGVFAPEIAEHINTASHMKLYPAGLEVANGDLELRLDEGTVLPYSELIAPVTTENLNDHASQAEAYATSHANATASLRSGKAHIEFTNGSSAMTDAIRTSVRETIRYARDNLLQGRKRVPLEVTGYRNSSEARNLSLERANNVAAYVRSHGAFEAAHVTAIDGGDRYWGHRYAKIRALPLPRVLAQVDYRAAIHEFGHCLGLPDEYRLYPGMSVEDAHDEFADLCRDNRLTHPPFPEKHDSIMSCGSKVSRCHYVTILDCLKTITNDQSWVILNT